MLKRRGDEGLSVYCRSTKETINPNFDLEIDLCRSTVAKHRTSRIGEHVLSARECNGHSFYIDDIDNIVVEGEYYNSSAARCQAWQVAH